MADIKPRSFHERKVEMDGTRLCLKDQPQWFGNLEMLRLVLRTQSRSESRFFDAEEVAAGSAGDVDHHMINAGKGFRDDTICRFVDREVFQIH